MDNNLYKMGTENHMKEAGYEKAVFTGKAISTKTAEMEYVKQGIDTRVLPPKALCFPNGFTVEYFEEMPGYVYLRMKFMSNYKNHCPNCGKSMLEVRGSHYRTEVRDLPYLGRELSWELAVSESRCTSCQRESFVPVFPGFLEKGEQMTVRLKEFAVFLAAAASSEGAAKILRELNTVVSGDTILRTVQAYRANGSRVWQVASQTVKRPIRRLSDEQAAAYAADIPYFMEKEILSMDSEKRLASMAKLMKTVFDEKKSAPEYEKKKERYSESIWKEE